MLEFARPGFLLAGALLALVPPILHLIARRQPERAPLPTARFLSPAPHTTVRIQRRPTDLLLMLLRSALLFLLGTALAGPAWTPRPGGTLELVLVDRGEVMAGVWDEVRQTVDEIGSEHRALVVFDTTAAIVDSLGGIGPAGPADYAAAIRAIGDVVQDRPDADSLRITLITRPRWEAWTPALAELRKLAWPGEMRVVGAEWDRTDPHDEGTGQNKASGPGPNEASGPGPASSEAMAAEIVDLEQDGDAPPADVTGGATEDGARGLTATGTANPLAVGASVERGIYVRAALEALGWEVRNDEDDAAKLIVVLADALAAPAPSAAGGTPANTDSVATHDRPTDALERPTNEPEHRAGMPDGNVILERARAGATVIVSGGVPSGALGEALPWRVDSGQEAQPNDAAGDRSTSSTTASSPPSRSTTGQLVLDDEVSLDGVVYTMTGEPSPGTRVIAVREDGTAVAAAAVEGAGCLVFLSASLEGGRLPHSPRFPRLLEMLAGACESAGTDGSSSTRTHTRATPLDRAAFDVLRGEGAPATVAAATVVGVEDRRGRPLGRWLLVVVLAVALVETWIVVRRRRA